ncbi:MAG: GTP-binding protein, partial [Clostridia bacterium]|nr:GTP-binding protein [Clostridia bacterium]
TAGIRRHSKVEDRVEKFSVIRANMAIERADVCLLMIDANDGVTEQDEKIAGLAHEAGKACIIVINKWDSIEKENNTVNEFNKKIRTALAYMPYAPIIYVSALTGQRCANIYKMINDVYEQSQRRITTGMLNDLLNDAQNRVQPPSDKGKRLKIYYMTQTAVAPPTFVIFCNSEELFHFSYRRYIENCIRDTFGFEGTPIRMVIRQKGDDSTKI